SFIMGLSTSDSIVIVGAGDLGLSTALHLSQRGYTDISVFDKNDHIPSGDLTTVVYRAAQAAGVQFFLGQPVDEVIYVSTLAGRKNAGIRTRDARFHPSSLVIIEIGVGDSDSRPGIDRVPDSLASPLSWYSSSSNSLVGFVPHESSSVILLGKSAQSFKMSSLVGPRVLELLEGTNDQHAGARKLSRIPPQTVSRL
ncbi:hypothetical protein N7475_003717, partial [Penicillium sp. IBT 31633x]